MKEQGHATQRLHFMHVSFQTVVVQTLKLAQSEKPLVFGPHSGSCTVPLCPMNHCPIPVYAFNSWSDSQETQAKSCLLISQGMSF